MEDMAAVASGECARAIPREALFRPEFLVQQHGAERHHAAASAMEDLRGGVRCGAGRRARKALYSEVFSARVAAADGGADCETADGAQKAASPGGVAGARDADECAA